MATPFPEPSAAYGSRADVLLGYLDYFRARVVDKLASLPEPSRRVSRLPSGWTPVQLLAHLTHMERRWVEWGFAGVDIGDPWADERDGHWFVADTTTFGALAQDADAQAARLRSLVAAHPLDAVGAPGPRWAGADPASLERVLLHVLQEYARHLGQLDVVVELAGGDVGE